MKITIESNGKSYAGQIATIDSTHLGINDRGLFTAGLDLRGEGWGVNAGGAYCLDDKPDAPGDGRKPTALGMAFILALMETVGVSGWEELKGKRVIALSEDGGWGSRNEGIANIDSGKALIFADFFEEWSEE